MLGQLCTSGGAIRKSNSSAGAILVAATSTGHCGCAPPYVGGVCNTFCSACCDSSGHVRTITAFKISGSTGIYNSCDGNVTHFLLNNLSLSSAAAFGHVDNTAGAVHTCGYSTQNAYIGYYRADSRGCPGIFVPTGNVTPPAGTGGVSLSVNFQIFFNSSSGTFTASAGIPLYTQADGTLLFWTSGPFPVSQWCNPVSAGPFTLTPTVAP